MKIDDKKYVETTVSGGTAFSVENSSKIFRVLSKNIYKNPIMAFVRELITNAVDAHIDAGTTSVPIEIKTPTALDHMFYVRDYGTGMSHEDLLKIYKTYFKSTKTNDNSTDGMYGLGSKSPFAYSNDFMVDSFFNGVKYSYLAMFDETDCPQFVPLSQDQTDEANGIKVSITIKQNDFSRVISELIRVLAFVDHPVKLLDSNVNTSLSNVINHIKQQTVFENNDILIVNRNSFNNMSNIGEFNVIQGNVVYPVDMSTIQSISNIKYFNGINNASNFRFFFKFPRGEINIPPSREEISYDKIYVEKIVKKSENVIRDITADFNDKLEKTKTYIDYCSLVCSIKNQFSNSLNCINRLFYRADVNLESVIKIGKNVSFDHPFKKYVGDVKVTRNLLADISDAYNVQRTLLSAISTEHVPIGTVVYHRSIREFLTKAGLKKDDYTADIDKFKCKLSIDAIGEICLSPSEAEVNYAQNKMPGSVAPTAKVFTTATSRAYTRIGAVNTILVKEDGISDLSYVLKSRLVGAETYNNSLFFMSEIDKQAIDFVKEVYDSMMFAIFGSHDRKLFISVMSSAEAREKLIEKKSADAYKNVEIKVKDITFNQTYAKNVYNTSFCSISSQKTINDPDACKAIIESKKYIIIKTYGSRADVEYTLGNEKLVIHDHDEISSMIEALWVLTDMSKYSGVVYIKKTTYDALIKKQVDMSLTIDDFIPKFLTAHAPLFDKHVIESNNYDHVIKLAEFLVKNLPTQKINDTIFNKIINARDSVVKTLEKRGIKAVSNRAKGVFSKQALAKKVFKVAKYDSLIDTIRTANSAYPLLNHIPYYDYQNCKEEILNYVVMSEKTK